MYKTLAELAEARAEAWKALLEQRAKSLRPKDKDVTELDRKVLMDALSAEKERDYLFLDSLYEFAKREGIDGLEQYHGGTGSAFPSAGSPLHPLGSA